MRAKARSQNVAWNATESQDSRWRGNDSAGIGR